MEKRKEEKRRREEEERQGPGVRWRDRACPLA
jgi:hypothetical protein